MSIPVYGVAQLQVKDMARYMAEYGMPTWDVFKKYNVEILAATNMPKVLEGEWDANWTVVVKFEDQAAADTFYNSPEYEPFKKLRMESLTDRSNFVMIPGIDPALLAQG